MLYYCRFTIISNDKLSYVKNNTMRIEFSLNHVRYQQWSRTHEKQSNDYFSLNRTVLIKMETIVWTYRGFQRESNFQFFLPIEWKKQWIICQNDWMITKNVLRVQYWSFSMRLKKEISVRKSDLISFLWSFIRMTWV